MRPLSILLIDDNPADIKITARAFKSQGGFECYDAEGGAAGIDYLLRKNKYEDAKSYPLPDLILLDIKMPSLSGLDVLKEIKQRERIGAIPVIMLTSSVDQGDILRSYEYGAAGYIQKPVSYDEFVTVVDQIKGYWGELNQLPERES